MKKKIISIAIATVFAVSSSQVLADMYDEGSTENELNYTAIGIGATSGGLILGPVGILVGGVIGSFYGYGTPEDESQSMISTAEPIVDAFAENPVHDSSDGLMLASSSEVIPFFDQDTSAVLHKASDRIKEIIINDFNVVVYFKPGSVDVENFYSKQFSTLTNLLNEMPELELTLDGYSDRQGSQSDNLQLSTERLESVRNYFINNGIDESRIHIHAHGETNFLSTAGELDSYMFDRRVVVSFNVPVENQQNNVAEINDLSNL
jgi:outer membrane protein OmpA-like peptidoglycan-associated protein